MKIYQPKKRNLSAPKTFAVEYVEDNDNVKQYFVEDEVAAIELQRAFKVVGYTNYCIMITGQVFHYTSTTNTFKNLTWV